MRETTKIRLNEEADKYGTEFIKSVISGHDGAVFIHPNTKDVLRKHFLAGADGMNKVMWRNIEDAQPLKKTDEILVWRDGQVVMGANPWMGTFTMRLGLVEQITPFKNGDKWCYLDDILPI